MRVLQRVEPVLDRDLPADVLGRARSRDVAADPRRERATRALAAGPTARQRPGRVALGLLLVADDEHTFVPARLDQRRAGDRRRRAHRAGGVHAVDGLPDRAERVGQRQLRHHHRLERVGRLADHDRVDVGERHARVLECFERRPPHEPVEGHVELTAVVGLADADDCARPRHQSPPSMTHTRFCCRHGPLDACATPRFADPRLDPVRDLDDPDQAGGHDRVPGQRAPGRVDGGAVAETERVAQDQLFGAVVDHQLGDVDRRVAQPRLLGRELGGHRAASGPADPGWCDSMRWSIPRIHAGLSERSRARSPAAMITAAAPSEIGGRSCVRSGAEK